MSQNTLPAPRLQFKVTWTSAAREAMEVLAARGEFADASAERRRWGAALRKAARACAAQSPPRGAVQPWAKRHAGDEWIVDATFVADSEMRELNAQHRGKDRPTDVLSFSQAEAAPDDDGEPMDDALLAALEAASGGAVLGDLVIAVETAQRQAVERAHDGATEVLFLSIHGALHLLGYDHQTASQRRVMWREQDALFERLRGKEGAAGLST